MKDFIVETLNMIVQGVLEMFVGYLWSLASPILKRHPSILVAIPGLAEDRGAVYGSLAAKFSTMLHLGEARSLSELLMNRVVKLSIVYGFLSGLFVVLLSGLISSPIDSFLYFLVSRGIGLAILIPLTAFLTLIAFKNGLNVDLTVVSLITVIADLISAFSIFLTFNIIGIPFMLITILLFLFALKEVKIKNKSKKKEYAFSVLIASTISTMAGMALAEGGAAGNKAILAAAPLVMALNGSASMNFASWLGTALALGEVDPRKPFNLALIKTWLRVSAETIIGVGISTALFSIGLGIKPMLLAVVTTLILRVAMPLISVVISCVSFIKGWDPDLITIPLTSSLNDFISASTLVITALIIGLA